MQSPVTHLFVVASNLTDAATSTHSHSHHNHSTGYVRTLVCSLSPDDDPLCALLMVDFYAIRAEDYTFLQQLYLEWEVGLHQSRVC